MPTSLFPGLRVVWRLLWASIQLGPALDETSSSAGHRPERDPPSRASSHSEGRGATASGAWAATHGVHGATHATWRILLLKAFSSGSSGECCLHIRWRQMEVEICLNGCLYVVE